MRPCRSSNGLALALGRAAGFESRCRLVPMPDGMPPALVVERFDIRRGADDRRLLALEDLCSVLDLPTEAKYSARWSGSSAPCARYRPRLKTMPSPSSTCPVRLADRRRRHAPEEHGAAQDRRTGRRDFPIGACAPLYDAVTTRVFPSLGNDHMALKLNGKDDELRRRDFRSFASTAGIGAAAADAATDELLQSLQSAVKRAALPDIPDYGPDGRNVAEAMLGVVRGRTGSFV